MAYKEYLLSTDSFKKPKVLEGYQAAGLLLTRLLLMEPGTDPLRPEMGVGLVSKYRFVNESKVLDLEADIKDQMSQYLPELQGSEINFVYNPDKTVDIIIYVNDVQYTYDSSENIPITLESMKAS